MKVVFIGASPIARHGVNDGLAFSQLPHFKSTPQSMAIQSLMREYVADLRHPYPKTLSLKKWAEEGVLLLNVRPTCEPNDAKAHLDKGWERFLIEIVCRLSRDKEGLVFVLFGVGALEYKGLIDETKHHVIALNTPGNRKPVKELPKFRGSRLFSNVNRLLGNRPIDWRLK